MSNYTNKFTVAISAPPGALGHYLAALLEHAVNDDMSFDHNSPLIFTRASQSFFSYLASTADSAQQVLAALDTNTQALPEEPNVRVIASVLAPIELAKIFPNSKIINITTLPSDSFQLGFNHLLREAIPSGIISPTLGKAKAKAEQFFAPAEQNIDWNTLAVDPHILDNAPVQYVIKSLAAQQAQGNNPDNTGCSSPVLDVEFGLLCNVANKNHEADNRQSIATIVDYLDALVNKDVEPLQTAWVDFMNSFTAYYN